MSRYINISKSHEIIKTIKQLKTSSKPKHLYLIEDLSILELCIENADNLIDKFTNYGSLFIGNYSAEVFGDYISGTNHTLPTNQVAKYCGGLSVFDYIKIQTYQIISGKAIFHSGFKSSGENGKIIYIAAFKTGFHKMAVIGVKRSFLRNSDYIPFTVVAKLMKLFEK